MTPRLPRITAAELLRALRRAGWETTRQQGSHVQLEHPDRPGQVLTVAVHAGRIIPLGTIRAILDTAGLEADDLRKLL